MAGWDGSGNFTVTHDWTDDKAAGVKITASRFDTNTEDIRGGIESCLTKNGENAATSDLPMGGNKHTGAGNATDRDNYLTMGQFQDADGIYYVSTGSSNTYAITAYPAITAYASGNTFKFNANHTNTGAATLNVNAVGAVTIKKNGTEDLESGDIASGRVYEVTYDGTNFQLQSPIDQSKSLTSSTKTADYTVTQTDNGTIIYINSASPETVTLPQNSTEDLSDGFNIAIVRLGAGAVDIAPQGTDNINGANSAVDIIKQYGVAGVTKRTDGEYVIWGDIA